MNTSEARHRRGAMTMAMKAASERGERVLRVGVVENGTIVSETTFAPRRDVRVGRAEDNDFVLGDPASPSRTKLFEHTGDSYRLVLSADMHARVSSGGSTRDLTDGAFDLDSATRGRIAIGNASVLFQFVVPPPARTRPALPAAARGGFVSGIDWTFTAFAAMSYLAFFGFVLFLDSADFEVEASLAERVLMSEFALVEPPAPPPDEIAMNDVADDTTEAPPSRDTPTRPRSRSNTRPSPVPDAASIAQRARDAAQAMLIGAFDERSGALDNVLLGGGITSSQADILAQFDGVQIASNDRLTTQHGGGSGIDSDDIGNLVPTNPTGPIDEPGPPVERRIVTRTTILDGGETGGVGTNFDEGLVVGMIRGRQSALRRCYETALHENPALGGRVGVQFTIQPQGNVSGAHATENTTGSASLAQCVVRVVSSLRWRQGPEGGSISYSYPFMFARQE
jgi:hypothetical protein